MGKKEFIEKVNTKYGIGRYEVIGDYKNNKTKVLIRCLTCGNEWLVRPDNFINKQVVGCPRCATKKSHDEAKISTDEIKRRGRELYGDRYSYDKTDTNNRDEKGQVCFTCNVCHKDFWLRPSLFLSGKRMTRYNCPNCVKDAYSLSRKRKEERRKISDNNRKKNLPKKVYDNLTFIEELEKKFPNVYDTSKVNFVDLDTKVLLKYKDADVEITPRSILKVNKPITRTKVVDTESFIKRAMEVHGDEYIYDDKTKYVGAHSKITIKCKKHGYFELWVCNHLNGAKCPMCNKENVVNPKKKSFSEFLQDAIKLHNGKYIYDEDTFTNYSTPMRIICPKHGEFWQTPSVHNHGFTPHGCPICKESIMEKGCKSFFNENSIEFHYGKHFIWLGKQHLDFYLPKYNIAIECQGKQHFGKGFGGDELNLKTLIDRDVKKNRLCKENNVMLYYLLPKTVNLTDVIDNDNYYNIYNASNTFKQIESIMDKNEIGL